MGTVINIHSGDWVRKNSGVGAGIDSYYEYCLKAYILLGDEKYLARFNRHYNAVMKYISRGPVMLDVHMHRYVMFFLNFDLRCKNNGVVRVFTHFGAAG